MSEIDLLKINRGTISAPAGCGKTHLISEALKRHGNRKPILVLTHTNAGVVALRDRLNREGVPSSTYRLATIDGWAIRLVSMFPARAKLEKEILHLVNPGQDYPQIRNAAITLLKGGHINDILTASYAHLVVDEYQDCSVRQHAIVFYAAQALPTCALGDPLQAIFGFGSDALANWEKHVCEHFPLAGELNRPWRWINAGAVGLGEWLLDVRRKLLAGEQIDLSTAPAQVQWIPLDGVDNHARMLKAARIKPPGDNGHVLIIGDSVNADSRHRIASSVPGAVTVEAVDLRDLVTFARNLNLERDGSLVQIANFAQSIMTNVGATDLVRRVDILSRGAARKEPSEVERAALDFVRKPTYRGVLDLLVAINKEGGVRVFRPAVLRACIKALYACINTPSLSFYEAATQAREQNRMQGRPLPRRAVGSTLLLKGLEAEAAVILNATNLDMRNLYVAMTRGSKSLVICSSLQILNPSH
ncbi:MULTISPECIES: UvrD-helicase domain-containing protein [Nitrosomonas]|uniref:DNA 3'-5' helicase II n=1 Tax=Nitrosomonas communis TaxID=44574 RepID=A0A5D3YHA3_9PROT|nr:MULTISPECIES: UvrD-helicase domain-containing protein [Nitrosomonas]TYP89513.1 DNA helicase-2/ATP-dependent DNA helicase PcrA [Nitrosomonas communis]UVS60245.1 ATP-dependent helicase [Nitrosomonas sp. PLL12]